MKIQNRAILAIIQQAQKIKAHTTRVWALLGPLELCHDAYVA